MNPLKLKIRELVACGKSFNAVSKELGISKSCVFYHSSDKNADAAHKSRSKNKKKFVSELKERAGGKCCRCGYNKCKAALHFHHKDPAQKTILRTRNGMILGVPGLASRRGKDLAEAEILKCELICANCHAEDHWPDKS